MKTMNMPGFTAEKSLHKRSSSYHTIAILEQASGFVQPTQIIDGGDVFPPPPFCDPFCIARCRSCKQQFYLSGNCRVPCCSVGLI
jgi:hypothetical protein